MVNLVVSKKKEKKEEILFVFANGYKDVYDTGKLMVRKLHSLSMSIEYITIYILPNIVDIWKDITLNYLRTFCK